jgi:hypothetical protein
MLPDPQPASKTDAPGLSGKVLDERKAVPAGPAPQGARTLRRYGSRKCVQPWMLAPHSNSISLGGLCKGNNTGERPANGPSFTTPRSTSAKGQNAKYSPREHVFRVTPNNGHPLHKYPAALAKSAVDFQKGLNAPALWRPLYFERVTSDRARIDVTLDRE